MIETDELPSKRCSRCGYVQILEGFPVHMKGGRPVRSGWCVECWRDKRIRDQGGVGRRANAAPV